MPSASILPDPQGMRREVEHLVRRLSSRGKPLTLIGYDANGIQQYVTRAKPLPYMRGASQRIIDFDRHQSQDDECLFAAGGRGRLLVRGTWDEPTIARRLDALRARFAEETGGEVLATCAVPFDPSDPRAAMAHLAARLEITKDAAPPPRHSTLGAPSFTHCAVCQRRPVADGCFWWFGQNQNVRACTTCDAIIRRGNWSADRRRERGKTLEDLSTINRVAVVSADGNQMGDLFRSMTSLVDSIVASRAVSAIFQGALEAALGESKVGPDARVTPVVGGDDIRLFIGPEHVFDVIERLVHHLESTVDRCARALGFPPEVADHFARIGIGIGCVIGPETHPASLAIEQAHALEVSAKAHGRRAGYRSAIDFIHLRSGDELIAGVRGGRHPLGISSFTGGEDELATARRAAAALVEVPGSQRSGLLRAMDREWDADAEEAERQRAEEAGRRPERHIDPELVNLLRYQVARSTKWQTWYEALGVDWTDGDAVARGAPTHAMLEMARLLDLTRRGGDR